VKKLGRGNLSFHSSPMPESLVEDKGDETSDTVVARKR
jgi:hypothetical protein